MRKFRQLQVTLLLGGFAVGLVPCPKSSAQASESALLNRAVEICTDYTRSISDRAKVLKESGFIEEPTPLAWPFQDTCLTNQVRISPGARTAPKLVALKKRGAKKAFEHCLENRSPTSPTWDPKKLPDIERILARYDFETPSGLGGVTLVSIEVGYAKWKGSSETVNVIDRCYVSARSPLELKTNISGLPRKEMSKADRDREWGEYYRYEFFLEDRNAGGVRAIYSKAIGNPFLQSLSPETTFPVETFKVFTLQAKATN